MAEVNSINPAIEQKINLSKTLEFFSAEIILEAIAMAVQCRASPRNLKLVLLNEISRMHCLLSFSPGSSNVSSLWELHLEKLC